MNEIELTKRNLLEEQKWLGKSPTWLLRLYFAHVQIGVCIVSNFLPSNLFLST
jgi:hypothetical protein